ncbi:MAG TPA: hypothetical protein PKJ29_09410, partial [Giesbergeria sp.]|nr:hypothetical protein [Giesbergeria sp.]
VPRSCADHSGRGSPFHSLAPQKNSFIQGYAFSNGIPFFKRCAALGLPFLWASPGGFSSVFGLFAL